MSSRRIVLQEQKLYFLLVVQISFCAVSAAPKSSCCYSLFKQPLLPLVQQTNHSNAVANHERNSLLLARALRAGYLSAVIVDSQAQPVILLYVFLKRKCPTETHKELIMAARENSARTLSSLRERAGRVWNVEASRDTRVAPCVHELR